MRPPGTITVNSAMNHRFCPRPIFCAAVLASICPMVLAKAESAPQHAPGGKFTVAVYCASSDRPDPKYAAAAERLGTELGRHGWALVYGGSSRGLMGAYARGAKAAGAHVTGVLTDAVRSSEVANRNADELLTAPNMRERKATFQARANAFLILPGGTGTADELFDTLQLKLIGQLNQPIILFNQDGYYDSLLAFLDHCIQEKFSRDTIRERYAVARTETEVMLLLEKASREAQQRNTGP